MSDEINYKDELELVKNEFETNKFSKRMCDAIREQTDIQRCIKDLVKDSLKEDVSTQEIIKSIIWKNWKAIGGMILTLILFPFLTSFLTQLINKWIF